MGKILRVNPGSNGVVSDTVEGNPFLETPGALPSIWAYGLRNPFRFSFDRLTGALVIGDVGQKAREEVDYSTRLRARSGRQLRLELPRGTDRRQR